MTAGFEPAQRRLNAPQTTGHVYRNLSQATQTMTCDNDVAVPMRDGVELLADVHRPAEPGRYQLLVAASPYPRQILDLARRLGSSKLAPVTGSCHAASGRMRRTVIRRTTGQFSTILSRPDDNEGPAS